MSEDRGRLEPFAQILRKLSGLPSAIVLAGLGEGARRLTEILEENDTLDEALLSDALRELDAAGLVTRRVEPGPPLRVLYAVTEEGARIAPAIRALTDWVKRSR